MYFKGYPIRVHSSARANAEYPGINAWFDAMEELPAYQLTKSDYYTHAWQVHTLWNMQKLSANLEFILLCHRKHSPNVS